MSGRRQSQLTGGVAAAAVWLLVGGITPSPAHAAFNVGAQVGSAITVTDGAQVTIDGTSVNPFCGSQGGTSMAVVQGSKLKNVDPIQYPVLLAMSCLDNGGGAASVTRRSQINFIDPKSTPASAKLVKTITTTISGAIAAPSNGWAHLVLRPDQGDLLGCGTNGSLYKIAFSQFSATPPTGTPPLAVATSITRPGGLSASCTGLTWDAEKRVIYQGATSSTIYVLNDATATETLTLAGTIIIPPTTATPSCTAIGLASTGGVLVVACQGRSTILRLDKATSGLLTTNNSEFGVLGSPAGATLNPSLGDLACDPTTFQSVFKDAMWSRNGNNGNAVVALEFPAYNCGLPSTATVLYPGLYTASNLGDPATYNTVPRVGCFDGPDGVSGNVLDADGDGIPDCWERKELWLADADGKQRPGIDFDGNGTRDLVLCVMVDTNGDDVADTEECAVPDQKDIFVEIDYMQFHRPDPLALSQPSIGTAGVTSIRESFKAAPPSIRIHFQVDEQVSFFNNANPAVARNHVNQLAFTPCTGPVSFAIDPNEAADFDAIKNLNFGTASDKAGGLPTLNAKRLVFHYALFGHGQVGTTAGGGSGGSGCSEVGGDDVAITLGNFTTTSVGGVSHGRGTTDQQAGTLMHEIGHNLGLRHGGGDNTNCKPNHLSVMSYSRQFASSPIPNRRLDYSRALLPDLNELLLNELAGLAVAPNVALDPSLGPLGTSYPSADQTAFGPSAWSVVPATGVACSSTPSGSTGTNCINWDRTTAKVGGKTVSTYQTATTANLNQGSGGCDGSESLPGLLEGHDDWSNLVYRTSAALDFAGGTHSANTAEHVSISSQQEADFFVTADLDGNGVGDGQDCGSAFPSSLCPLHQCGTLPDGTPQLCSTHRIDIKPSDPTNTFSLGKNANIAIAIYSETNGAQIWNAPAVVVTLATTAPLTFTGGGGTVPAVTNKNGQGTCSVQDIDPKDPVKDLVCQFPVNGSLVLGTQYGVVTGFFKDPVTGELREFRARQLVTVTP
jgi:hypothetical protein